MDHSLNRALTTDRRQFDPPLVIGVLADTHVIPHGTRRLPPEVLDLFTRAGVGLILHAGDVNTAKVLRALQTVAPTIAVSGNGDDAELQEALPTEVAFTAGRYVFAMIHGHLNGRTARISARRFAGRVDCVVYGHSHVAAQEIENGTLLFNPGSATDRRWQEHFGVGLIHVTDDRVVPELVLYHDARYLTNVYR